MLSSNVPSRHIVHRIEDARLCLTLLPSRCHLKPRLQNDTPDGGSQLLQLLRQSFSMYLAFFTHSPAAAQPRQEGSMSTQPPAGGASGPPIRPT